MRPDTDSLRKMILGSLVGLVTSAFLLWVGWVSSTLTGQIRGAEQVAAELKAYRSEVAGQLAYLKLGLDTVRQENTDWRTSHTQQSTQERGELNQKLDRIETMLLDVRAMALRTDGRLHGEPTAK